MINTQNIQPEIFQTHISFSAHVQAEKFRRYQSQAIKAKQVYLNTLAVYVVNSYLNLIGWSTNLSHSDSWNPISQTMMNVADLQIPGYGKLECRPILIGQDTVTVPPEVCSDRIGYLIVMLDLDLQNAQLVGFARQVDLLELPIAQLESLSKFPTYLSQQKRAESSVTADLNEWMKGALNSNWQQLEELFAPTVVLKFRSKQELAQSPASLSPESRVKLVELGTPPQTIALILGIQPLGDREFNVSIKVSNYQCGQYLPEGLELVIVDCQSHPVMIAQANQTETVEFCFSGELQEKFTVEISLESQLVVEKFAI